MRKLHKKIYMIAAMLLALTMLNSCGTAPTPEATPEASPEPTLAAASAPTTAPTPQPTATPEPRAERVEDDYFADAAFFGNSLMDGLHRFGGMEQGAFFAGTSASVISVESTKDAALSNGKSATLLEALLEEQYGKIYVLLGINELGFNTDGFIDLYTELLGKIAEAEPDAQLYIMSLTPITEGRSKTEDIFTKERVQEYNEAIRAMTERQGYVFLDLFDALSDKDGWLPDDHSTDGVHFTADTYLDWAEYLRRNYDGAAHGIAFYKDYVAPPAPVVTNTPQPTPTPTPAPTETVIIAPPASPSDLHG